uniref:Uncharacterized protein n=1 Tax=Scleropages formosus TaxID=113540 RepID=A0A8C9SGK4_SCLFO
MSMITTLIWDSASGTLMLIFAALLFLILLFEPSAKDDKYKFPPGPRPWPFIGNLNILDMHRPYNTMCKLSEQGLTRATQTFSNGVVFSVGESWKTMRRFTLTTLRDVGMGRNTIEDRIVEEVHAHLHPPPLLLPGKPFNPRVNIYSAVSNIICHLVFGHHFEYDDPVFLQLQSRVFSENVCVCVFPADQVYNLFPKLGAMLRNFKRVKKNMAANRYYFSSVCRQHKAELDSNDLRSFLDSFLAQQKEESRNANTYFDEENMVVTIANLFAAGTETTSTTLRWGLLFMMKYPHIQVHAEIERVICKDRALRFEDPKSMPYTDAVVHEIQCFANMVPNNLLHQTKEDTTFRGYHIPKRTPIIPLLTSTLCKLNPGHFLDAEGRFVKKDAFLPFSAGE